MASSQNELQKIFTEPSPSLPPYLSQQQRNPDQTIIGERTLMDIHSQQKRQVQNQAMNNPMWRCVRPSISTMTPQHSLDLQPTHGCGVPSLQQISPQMIGLRDGMVQTGTTVATALPGVPLANALPNREILTENENAWRQHLREIEERLFDDEEEINTSVIINGKSKGSDTLKGLIVVTSQSQKLISTSSTSASSPSSSLSVASSVTTSSKQTILEAASAIDEGKSEVAAEILTRMTAMSNPEGNWLQKLIDSMVFALKSRLNPAENSPSVAEIFSEEHALSTQMLYDLSPCFKLGFLAANLVILDATLEQPSTNKLHVVDFDIGRGGQHVNLLHTLAMRQSRRPSTLKITAVYSNGGEAPLRFVGNALHEEASKTGINLQFRTVDLQWSNLNRETLDCEADETLVVNLAFKLYQMPDECVSEDNPRGSLQRGVKALSPRVVTLVEQEWNSNTAPFLGRVNESIVYYGTLLHSIESTVSKDHPDRVRVEEGLRRKLKNSIACEGRDRVERCEVFGKWRARMGMAGFVPRPIYPRVSEPLRARLVSYRAHPGFTIKEVPGGGVGFGWHGKTLTVASDWRSSNQKNLTDYHSSNEQLIVP